MGQLVGESEHLGSLGVRPIDKDDGRQRVHEREAAKLLRVQLAAIVTAYDAAHHDQNAELVRQPDEAAERLCPGWRPAALLEVEAEGAADAGSRLLDVARQCDG